MPQAVKPEIAAIRRSNLIHLLDTRFASNKSELARATQKAMNNLNLIMSDNERHRRPMGEGLARDIEVTLGLPDGWFDQPRNTLGEMNGPVRIEAHVHRSLRGTLSEPCIKSLHLAADELEKMGPITSRTNLILAAPADASCYPLQPNDTLVIDIGEPDGIASGLYVLWQAKRPIIRRVELSKKGEVTLSDSRSKTPDTLKAGAVRNLQIFGRIVGVLRSMRV
jgi:hypothetical protein